MTPSEAGGIFVRSVSQSGQGLLRGLIFDPFAGISGDMILGALVDLGLAEAWLKDTVASTGLDGVAVGTERVMRQGIACHRVWFDAPEVQPERHLEDVFAVIDGTGATDAVRGRAKEVFRRLAEAEAEVHGTSPERVHFHEVGAVDSILDVLCVIGGVAERGYEAFYTRPIAVGQGSIEVAHGRYPVPAPATAKLLHGLPVRDAGYEGECTTPTGAALLATLTGGRRSPVESVLGASGFGAGSRDPGDRPNCLRLVECEAGARTETLYVLQADLDDMPPEYAAATQDALMRAGALDAVVLPLGMKKGRQGLRLEALAAAAGVDAVLGAMFASTSTLGVRYWPVERPALPREEEVVEWRGHRIRRKRVRLPDGGVRAKPEYEDVVRAARELGMSPYEARLALEREAREPLD